MEIANPVTTSADKSPVAHCFHCKAMQTIKDYMLTKTKNNKPRYSGTCEKCGTKVSTFTKQTEKKVEEPAKVAEVAEAVTPAAQEKKE